MNIKYNNYFSVVFAGIIVLSGCAGKPIIGNDTTLEQGVKRVLSDYSLAKNSGDLSQLEELYASDASVKVFEKAPLSGKEAILEQEQNEQSVYRYQLDYKIEKIEINNHLAVAQASFAKTQTPRDDSSKSITFNGVRQVELVLQRDGKWKIKRDTWDMPQVATNN